MHNTDITGTVHFKATIQNYLEQKAQPDELFASSYAKENKNIEECVTYLLNFVQKSGINGFTADDI
ncbi:MAG: PcfK-like family protein [Candidatus Azobacteroides sp.]|nr:PcfK-like family protein [Candidatus Azobacteroides sp.]